MASSDCISCHTFYKLLDTTCYLSCPDNSYQVDLTTCAHCHDSCASCHGPEETKCDSCPDSKYLDSTTSSCVESCPEGYFAN